MSNDCCHSCGKKLPVGNDGQPDYKCVTFAQPNYIPRTVRVCRLCYQTQFGGQPAHRTPAHQLALAGLASLLLAVLISLWPAAPVQAQTTCANGTGTYSSLTVRRSDGSTVRRCGRMPHGSKTGSHRPTPAPTPNSRRNPTPYPTPSAPRVQP